MHAYNRTLLAKLGFADPDRKESKHDLACRYLAQPEISRSILNIIHPGKPVKNERIRSKGYLVSERVTNIGEAVLEKAVNKGEGQYKTTVGFIDVAVPYFYEFSYVHESDETADKEMSALRHGVGGLGIEVKIQKVAIGDILRQINLYKEYFEKIHIWAVVTAYAMSEEEVSVLAKQGLRHFKLGESFNDFVAAAGKTNRPSDSPEV